MKLCISQCVLYQFANQVSQQYKIIRILIQLKNSNVKSIDILKLITELSAQVPVISTKILRSDINLTFFLYSIQY